MRRTDRLQYMDMAKGLGILGVIIGHHLLAIGLPNPYPMFVSWFWSFHMPMFFIISGYFIKPDLRQTVVKGCRQLMLPYFITCFCGAISVVLLILIKNGVYEGPSLHKWLFGITCFKDEYEQMAMWFLPVLFLSRCIYVAINKYFGSNSLYFFILLFVLSLWIKDNNEIPLSDSPLVLVKSMMATFFVFIGSLMRKFNFQAIKVTNQLLFVVLLLLFFAPMVEIDLGSMHLPYGLFSAINTSIISISVILFFMRLEKCKLIFLRPIINYLLFAGRHSLSFLCLHAFLYTIQVHKHLPFNNPLYHGIVITILISIVVYCYFLCKR